MALAHDPSNLTGRVEEHLRRLGVAGRVERNGSTLRLTGQGGPFVAEFKELEAWSESSPADRARIVERIARDLVRARSAERPQLGPCSQRIEWLRPFVVIVLVGAGIWMAWKWLGRPANHALAVVATEQKRTPNAVSNGVHSAAAPNLAHQCERVQSRISTGGTVSALDVDGWVVELMLLSADPAFGVASPQLDAFLARRDGSGNLRRLAWEEDDQLRALDAADTYATVFQESLAEMISDTKAGVRIVWSGKFVNEYFADAGRVRMQRLAAAIYEGTGANYGALYARCVSGARHQVGSWFRGQTLSSAVLSMVASMGLHAEMPHDDGADIFAASPVERRRSWNRLVEKVTQYDRRQLNLALSEDGGMIAARPGHWATLTFPFQDSNRATRASLRITRALGVAPRRN